MTGSWVVRLASVLVARPVVRSAVALAVRSAVASVVELAWVVRLGLVWGVGL
ncbi:hypothetical protein [Mycobacterium ulcerans]|uniref:hypothetical protein n=1 Tax=Mycobacterium ulcerans TaxID=1809 RepID=UPI003B8A8BA7